MPSDVAARIDSASAVWRALVNVVPDLAKAGRVLRKSTGWELIGVEGLLPELTFFDHLANRRFPVTWWIRKPAQIDYISEPDLFHDLFGHVPLLLNPLFADYIQAYGRGGVKAHGLGAADAARPESSAAPASRRSATVRANSPTVSSVGDISFTPARSNRPNVCL